MEDLFKKQLTNLINSRIGDIWHEFDWNTDKVNDQRHRIYDLHLEKVEGITTEQKEELKCALSSMGFAKDEMVDANCALDQLRKDLTLSDD